MESLSLPRDGRLPAGNSPAMICTVADHLVPQNFASFWVATRAQGYTLVEVTAPSRPIKPDSSWNFCCRSSSLNTP
jgi:hypothetical protein